MPQTAEIRRLVKCYRKARDPFTRRPAETPHRSFARVTTHVVSTETARCRRNAAFRMKAATMVRVLKR